MANLSAADDRPVATPRHDPSPTATRTRLGSVRRRAARLRRCRLDEHADRLARRSPDHQPRPWAGAVSPVSGRDELAAGHQRHVGGADRRLLRVPGVAVDPPTQPALAVDRRYRRLLRRSARPAGELGDLRRLRSPGRALPAVLAVLQRLTTSGTDAVVSRRIRELLRADRPRSALPSPTLRRAAHPSQQLARSASTCGRLHHRIHCGTSAERAHAVHVVEGRPVRLHARRRARCCISSAGSSRCTW